jgi:hypothetical protein
MIYNTVGYSMFFGFLVMALLMPLNAYVVKFSSKYQVMNICMNKQTNIEDASPLVESTNEIPRREAEVDERGVGRDEGVEAVRLGTEYTRDDRRGASEGGWTVEEAEQRARPVHYPLHWIVVFCESKRGDHWLSGLHLHFRQFHPDSRSRADSFNCIRYTDVVLNHSLVGQ